MKINLKSFFMGIIFTMAFFLFTGGLFMPKHLKVSSIEIIDQGDNESGYIVIKNADGKLISYLGASQSNRGILTLKDQTGNTKINISSNDNGGYFQAKDQIGNESVYLNDFLNKTSEEAEGVIGCSP